MAKNGNECQRIHSSAELLRLATKIFFRRAGRSGQVSRLERIRGQCVMTVLPKTIVLHNTDGFSNLVYLAKWPNENPSVLCNTIVFGRTVITHCPLILS